MNHMWPVSHDHTSTTGHSSSLGSSLRRRPGNIFDDLAHELARRSRTLRIPITPHLLSYFEPLRAMRNSNNSQLLATSSCGRRLLCNEG